MKKKTILFVCHGNSIRSIIAEAAFNHLCKKKYQAKSAGTLPAHSIDEYTKKVLKEDKIPLKKEKPTPLLYDEVVKADKLVLLHEDVPNFPVMIPEEMIIRWNIRDVVGHPIDDFRKARDEILEDIKELIKRLK